MKNIIDNNTTKPTKYLNNLLGYGISVTIPITYVKETNQSKRKTNVEPNQNIIKIYKS
jgi:hypothetical protein